MKQKGKLLQSAVKTRQDKKNAEFVASLRFCFPMRETRHRFACGKIYMRRKDNKQSTERGFAGIEKDDPPQEYRKRR